MAWTAPTTRSTGELITAVDWNTDVTDNLVALKDPPSDNYELNEGADYTTSSTSFVDIDATNLKLNLTTAGGDVLVGFHGSVLSDVYFDVDLDGTRVALDDGIIGSNHISTLAPGYPIGFVRLLTSVAAAAHVLKLQWKTVGGSTATLFAGAGTSTADYHPQFWAREVS